MSFSSPFTSVSWLPSRYSSFNCVSFSRPFDTSVSLLFPRSRLSNCVSFSRLVTSVSRLPLRFSPFNCVNFSRPFGTSVSWLPERYSVVTFSKSTLVSSPVNLLENVERAPRIAFSIMGSAMSFSGTTLVAGFALVVFLSSPLDGVAFSSFDSPHPTTNKPIKIEISVFIAERILPHHLDSEKFRELVVDTTV